MTNDNDDMDLQHSDDDSPGIAAKKARLRQAAKQTTAKPEQKPAPTMFETLRGNMARLLKPKKAGAEIIAKEVGGPDFSSIQTKVDDDAKIKATMRKAEASGDTTTLRRFNEKLKAGR